MAAARLQRWALLLAAHHYTIKYRRAADHGNVDGLSRLPLPEQHKDKQGTIDTFLVNHLECLPMRCADVRWETRSDITLSQVMEMVSTGSFPTIKESDSSLSPYLVRRNELTLLQGCVMWGNRVILPPKLRKQVLEELHTGHLGVVKMKAMARSYVWWPGLDAQIEEKCKMCVSCQRIQKTPSLTPNKKQLKEEIKIKETKIKTSRDNRKNACLNIKVLSPFLKVATDWG